MVARLCCPLAEATSKSARNFFISEFTVKGHLRSVFTKLNVLSRTEAISVATRRGLIQV
ncbi:MAG: LuxR C-terminal-related transcriptional regulator [Verrucomicrobiia bacterium]